MLSVTDAIEIVQQHCKVRNSTSIPLICATGLFLTENVASDIDSPPFDKAMMDGYAVRSAEIGPGLMELPVAAEVMAGQTPPPLPVGSAIRIMTGAPIPAGADSVVKIEQTQLVADGRVRIDPPMPSLGQHVMRRGQEMREGDVVLQSGSQLTPQAIGLLATVGRSSIQVRPRPTLAILSTGDELVEPENRPLAGQIRNSNAYMLIAQATRAGADVQYLGISRDHVDALTERIAVGLRGDVLVLSGGVSAGKLDLVPGVLRDLGTTVHFHQVAMKPGKPLLFGTCGETLVFGLPGNPVSSFCCFELFVRPALRKMSGGANAPLSWSQASLEEKYRYRTDRPTYHPSRVAQQNGRLSVRLVPWFGSPDLRALADANALALLPVGDNEYTAGQLLDVLPLD